MTAVANFLISTVLQLVFALLVVGAFWLLFGRRRARFGDYVGLTRPPASAVLIPAIFGIVLTLLMLGIRPVRELANAPGSVLDSARAQLHGGTLVAVLLVLAIFKTALAEELVFRGLIGKRLIAWLGLNVGNLLQALIFAAVHLLILGIATTAEQRVGAALLIVLIFVLGWTIGWLNERMGRGSIVPGWVAHAMANSVTYLVLGLRWL